MRLLFLGSSGRHALLRQLHPLNQLNTKTLHNLLFD